MDFLEAKKFLNNGYSIKRSHWHREDRLIKYLEHKNSFVNFKFEEVSVDGKDKVASDWIIYWE